jgi:hypothetical protein
MFIYENIGIQRKKKLNMIGYLQIIYHSWPKFIKDFNRIIRKEKSTYIEKKKSEKIALHGIPNRDPLVSLFETSNGI